MMSKTKTPQAKKLNSWLKDRRNTYGENTAASRKGIKQGKQRGQQALRHAVASELRTVNYSSESIDADAMDDQAKQKLIEYSRRRFNKHSDEPLAVVVNRKLETRAVKQSQAKKIIYLPEILTKLREEKRQIRTLCKKLKEK
jgi:hypothetical protein